MEKSIKPFVLEYTLISREDEKRLNRVLLTPNNRMAIFLENVIRSQTIQ